MSSEGVPSPSVDAAGIIVGDVRCFRCGNPLAGIASRGFCPACGSPASASLVPGARPPAAPIPASAAQDIVCRRCLTNLRGLPWDGECPRCRLPGYLTLGAASDALLWDANGFIQKDVACRQCGYNLRGLKRDQRCPECGAAVAVSARENWLAFSAPEWVQKLARGSWLIMVGLTCAVLGFLGLIVIGMSMAGVAVGADPSAQIIVGLAALACLVLLLGGVVATYAGMWFVTAPDPSRAAQDQPVTARRLVRVSLLAVPLNIATQITLSLLLLPPPAMLAARLFQFALQAVTILGTWAYFRYLAGLAEQIPDAQLTKRSRSLATAFATLLSIVAFFQLIGILYAFRGIFLGGAPATAGPRGRPADLGGLFAFMGCFSAALSLFLLIYALIALRLQHRLKEAFRQQARIALENWILSNRAAEHSPAR